MLALDFLEPLPLYQPGQPLACALPSLLGGTPVAIPDASGWRVMCPTDALAVPASRQLCDLPSRRLPILPADEEIDPAQLREHEVWGAVKHRTLVGRVETSRALLALSALSNEREHSLAWVTREQLMPKLLHDLANALSLFTIQGGVNDAPGLPPAVSHLTALVAQIRTLYTAGPRAPEVTLVLDQLVRRMRPMLETAAHPAALSIECQGKPELCCQRWRIECVLLNLVLNASDAANTIRLSVQEAAQGRPGAKFIIEDNGPGFPQRASQRAPLVARSLRGHGLTSVQRQVAALGGRIQFGRAAGGGAKVSVWFPVRTVDEANSGSI